uniref:DNA-dependent protein kinase catalytic subunit n=2 Tax=Lygus hesperus TaxID=30085 RepID=A0A0A9YHG4_LYGHE
MAREVKYLRVYGNKKLPDVRITFSEVISTLQTLCKFNGRISGAIFTSLFTSVLSEMLDQSLLKRLEALIPTLLNNVVNRSSPDPTFLMPLLNLCWENTITLEPTLLYDVCKLCKTREVGVLLAEQNVVPFGPSPYSRVREPNKKITTDYYYILSLFHKELGHSGVSTSFDEKTCKSVLESYGSSRGNEECMQTIFSRDTEFKELAMLNDWDQLKKVLGRPELIESSLDWENRYFKRFLNYRVLSEVNCKMFGNDPSITVPMMEWLESRSRYPDEIQRELGDDLNMLYLVHNRLGDFKTVTALSVIHRIYFLGLDRQVSAIHHDVKLKQSFDNYVMANCLGTQDKSLFFHQLRIDELYYPETPIEWNQLIINRNYFLSFIHEQCKSPPEKPQVLIRKLQSDYIMFLIRKGHLGLVKHFYSKFLKDSSYSYLKDDFIEISMINLLESQNHLNERLKLECLWKSWHSLTLVEGFEEKGVTVLLHLLALCSEFVLCMETCAGLCPQQLREGLKGFSSNLEHFPLKEAIIRCGHESISRAFEHTEGKMQDAFRIAAEFCMKHLEVVSSDLQRQLNETSVKCILKSLALGNRYGHHMLLKALNIVLNDIHTEEVFLNESLNIDVSSLEFWLPQLIGFLNCGKGKILEPILVKLTEKCPQKLWLILRLYQSEQLNASLTLQKILKKLGPQMYGEKFVEALGTICHPNLLLKSYVSRLLRAQLPEDILKVYNEIKEKCFFKPHRGMMVGRIFMINDQYMDFIENIFDKKRQNCAFSDEETKMAVRTVEIQSLERYARLESFSPLLSSFNCNTFKFEIPRTGFDEKTSCSNAVTLASFSPNVSVIQSLRKPIKIDMLGSDGIIYPWIVKFDEDLRQDQYIQQLFSIINRSMKLRRDWNKENIITYKVVPFTPHYGIIEMVNSTLTMSSLINTSSIEIANIRNSLKEEHSKWIYQSLVEAPREDATTAYGQAAKFYSAEDVLKSFLSKSTKVPQDLLRSCILKYCVSPMEYFHRRINFLRSHSVLSACHWVTGVGDRHLNNFLFSTETCELIGIDFGFSFGAGVECLPVPELVPFRLTPQFLGAYIPLYTSGIMEDVMVKCLSSIDKDILLLAMEVLVQLPFHDMHKNIHEYNSKGAAVDHARWIIDAVQKKLYMENPLNVICEHLSHGRLEQYTVDIYRSVLERFSHFSKASSPKELVKMLIEMASDGVLLGLSHHNFEPWI